ncbi:MAG: hypothetical protein H6702_00365 [Myxococcales bacterium]|nr:hypothetical protein [Myxococcales bacterium]
MAELWRGAAGAAALALVILLAAGLAGQATQLRHLLAWLGSALDPWPTLAHATVLFAEATLPLAALVAGGLTYGRARRDGTLVAVAALGSRPLRLWAPAATLGIFAALSAWSVAHGPAPRAAQALRRALVAAAGDTLAQPPQQAIAVGPAVIARDRDAWWAAWGAGPRAVFLRAEQASGDVDPRPGAESLRVTLHGAHLWAPGVRVQARRARIRLAAGSGLSRLRQFGPPNATPSVALDRASPHAAFVFHRRWALGAAALPWALWAAGLAAALPAVWALPLGALGLAASYWLLRVGELAARAGFGSPWVAAWAPVALAALALALWLPRALRRIDP